MSTMAYLFHAGQKNLPDFFETISEEDIQDCCEAQIYYRGAEYFEYGHIAQASYNIDKTRLQTLVEGTSDYNVIIKLQDNQVEGSCTCPYGGICKHVIASLLYALNENQEIERIANTENVEIDIDQQLQSLSKKELIDLVKKIAPDQFWVEIKNKTSDASSAMKVFNKVEKNIQKLFNDNENLYDPDDFDAALDKEIKKLSGLEKQLKTEIESLLFYIINEVDHAFDDGYLYNHYNDYPYMPSDDFIQFVANYARSHSYEDKTEFIRKLDNVLKEQSYTTYDDLTRLSETVFTEDDLPRLKEMLMRDYRIISHSIIESYYKRARALLNEQEKEIILAEIQNNDPKWIIELAGLYDSQKQELKAIEAIRAWLTNNNGYKVEIVYMLYLDLLAKVGGNLSEAAKEAITYCPTCSMLKKIASLTSDELPDYELILEQKNESQLLEYLEFKERILEGLELIKRSKNIWGTQVFNFYKKHKRSFPLEAGKYFSSEIDKNLDFTGDNYYHTIADMISQLKVINSPLAEKYLQEIRLNYKRRRNLMTILSKL